MHATIFQDTVGGMTHPREPNTMMRQIVASASMVIALGVLSLGCKPGGVGDPCIPNDEFSSTYAGAAENGVAIEDRSFQCETRVCLVKNFRGRVSCPFGNKKGREDSAVLGYTGDDADVCMVPGTNVEVSVAVKPQCAERLGQVYCSCRCAGKDSAAKYCECPSGYECKQVAAGLSEELVDPNDKYCVKKNDDVSDTYDCPMGCDQVEGNCGFTSNTYQF